MDLLHGTLGRYRQGCKCRLCRMAFDKWAEGQRERNKNSGYGTRKSPVRPARPFLTSDDIEMELDHFEWLENYYRQIHEENQMILEESLFRHVHRRIH